MSGPKIRYAIENVQRIFTNKIYDNDSVMIITFNGSVDVAQPLTKKAGRESQIAEKISSLLEPTGSTGTTIHSFIPSFIHSIIHY